MWGDVLRVLAVMALIGLAAQPLARAALAPLPGGGAGLARPLGILVAAVPLWFLAAIGVLPYTEATAWLATGALAAAGAFVFLRGRRRPPAERPHPTSALLLGAELTFVAAFLLGVVVVSHNPDVWGTEKPMDMAFLTAIDQTRSFPPPDPWLAGEDLNYYYLGQYLIGYVMRLAGTGPTESYNLGVALVWALGASAAFGLGAAATATLRRGSGLLGGGLAALLTVVGGNFEGLRLALAHDGPIAEFHWFGASRVVPGGINDFPAFELLVGDLHAHVIAVPFTMVALAFALHTVAYGPRLDWRIVPAGVVVGALYPINAWSFPVCLGLMLLAGAAALLPPTPRATPQQVALWAAALTATSLLVYLPFHLGFDTGGAQGVALNPARRGLADSLGDMLRLYGLALVPLLIAIALALPRRARLAALAGLVLVPLLALADDLGASALLALALAGALAAAVLREGMQRFAFLLAAGGLLCVLAPEIVYVRDAFQGSDDYRMNTVYKVGFNAWLLFGIAAAVLLTAAFARRPALAALLGPLSAAALAFPIVGAATKIEQRHARAELDGLGWLDELAPGDRPAIAWLREHTPRGTVILEATGPEYSADGHARMATYSGRPTIIGWPGHELFWGPPERLGTRVRDVGALYRTRSRARARRLLDRYDVAYVIVGPTERATYRRRGVLTRLGRRVFRRDGTAIYDVRRT